MQWSASQIVVMECNVVTCLHGLDDCNCLHSSSSTKQMPDEALGAVDAQVVPWQGFPDSSILCHVSHWSGGAVGIHVVHIVCLDS